MLSLWLIDADMKLIVTFLCFSNTNTGPLPILFICEKANPKKDHHFCSTRLTSVCWGSQAIPGETLWVYPCSKHDELHPTWAQSDVEVVSGSCETGVPDLCPSLQTQLEWESKTSTNKQSDDSHSDTQKSKCKS